MLKIGNKTIIKNVRFAKNSWERTKGLMFEDKKNFNYALIFEFPAEGRTRCSIHMLFVFFPITVLFLDKSKTIVDKVKLQPFTPNYTPKKAAKYVIELPCGKTDGIKLGQKIDWVTSKK